jgi:hypothetical protein
MKERSLKLLLSKVVADYGNGEVVEKEAQAAIISYVTGKPSTPSGANHPAIFEVKPDVIEEIGSPNSVFIGLSDRCTDYKVKGIKSLELSVDKVMDYRKLTTALPLLAKLNFQIDQTVTIQTGDQFVRLIYQGALRGFQGYLTPTNALLGSADANADVMLKLTFSFEALAIADGNELATIKQALSRNPVEKVNLMARVEY